MKKIAAMLLFLLLLSSSGCTASVPVERELFAMDTLMQMKIWGDAQDAQVVCAEINRLDNALSATAANSTLALLNRSGSAAPSAELLALLTQSVFYAEQTDGAFDITVRPLMLAWGFTQEKQRIPDEKTLAALLPCVGTEHMKIADGTVRLDSGTQLDLGGIAKGYTAECCKTLLSVRGVRAAMLNLGGNVQTLGSKPDGSAWLVGIADPQNPSQAIASLTFFGTKSLVTSGSYQRYFEQDGVRYGHILDPKTGMPVTNGLASVTVVAESGTMADAYSTALFVMGKEKAAAFWRARDTFEAVLITDDGEIFATEGAAPLLSDCEFTVIQR